jgi:MFS family permease
LPSHNPTLLAAISGVAHPDWRASAVGVYRLWRDGGSAIGALLAGVVADLLGVPWAFGGIAAVTFASGVVVLVRMYETLQLSQLAIIQDGRGDQPTPSFSAELSEGTDRLLEGRNEIGPRRGSASGPFRAPSARGARGHQYS